MAGGDAGHHLARHRTRRTSTRCRAGAAPLERSVRHPRQQARLASGGLIDRSRTLAFSFDGRDYRGHAGDTLASALLASGVHLIGRSFKYHRPRGILSAGSEEPNALVTVDRGEGRVTPNL